MRDIVSIESQIGRLLKEIQEYDEKLYTDYIATFMPCGILRYMNVRLIVYLKRIAAAESIEKQKAVYEQTLQIFKTHKENIGIYSSIDQVIRLKMATRFVSILLDCGIEF